MCLLCFRVLDHDTYSANDAIGKIYVDLNPLLTKDPLKVISGWFPIYDTMHGMFITWGTGSDCQLILWEFSPVLWTTFLQIWMHNYFSNLQMIIWNILYTGYSWLNTRHYYLHKILEAPLIKVLIFAKNFSTWDFMFSQHETERQNLRILNSCKIKSSVIWY